MHVVKEIKNDNRVQNKSRQSKIESKHVQWYRLESNWVRINRDGTYKKTTAIAGCGGLLRDSSGNWLKGYTRKISLCDTLLTKMWVMFHGIELVWQERITNMKVKSDSKVLIDMINQEA